MSGNLGTLQAILDEVERRAIARANFWRGLERVDKEDWPYGVDEDEKQNEREAVVRSLFALLDEVKE